MKRYLSFAPFFLLLACPLQGQAPQGINYQAALRNGSGQALANSAVTMRFGIYSGVGATVKVYEETHALTSNSTGVVNCVIGKGTVTSGSFAAIDWGSDQFNLKAEANSGGGFLDLGTQQLISVPYSLYSNQSGGLSGNLPPSQISAGGAAADQVLSWNGSNWVPKNPSFGTITGVTAGTGLTGGGTSGTLTLNARNTDPLWNANQLQGNPIQNSVPATGSILRFSGTQWAPAAETVTTAGTGLSISSGTINSVWTQNGGNIYNNNFGYVGIGNKTPFSPLHVTGKNATVSYQFQGLGWNAYFHKNTYLGYLGVFNDTNSLDFGTGISGRDVNLVTNTTPRVTVKYDGKVGIGTTTPNFLLHMNDAGYIPAIQFTSFNTGTTLTDGLVIGFNTSSSGEGHFWNFENQALLFGTNSLERMRISAGGNIGIGVSGPSYLLDVGRTTNTTRVLNVTTGSTSVFDGAARFNNLSGTYSSLATVNCGIYGNTAASTNTNGSAIYGDNGGSSSVGWAGYFNGRVMVLGSLSKSSGTFQIDHPLDPENKYLYHSFVESPDMMNIYNGIAIADANGEAIVNMPDWFEALNMEFRYQLTCIGGYAPVYVAEKLKDNRFKIAGATRGLEISWQVTGIRHDAYAAQNRIQVEVEKNAFEKGTYLHPEVAGKPVEKGLSYKMTHDTPVKSATTTPEDPDAAQNIPGTTVYKRNRQ